MTASSGKEVKQHSLYDFRYVSLVWHVIVGHEIQVLLLHSPWS